MPCLQGARPAARRLARVGSMSMRHIGRMTKTDDPGARKAGKTSYVLCHQPKSFDGRSRSASPHPLQKLPDAAFAQVRGVLTQIIASG